MAVNSIGLDKLKLLDIPLFAGLDRMNLAKLVPVVEEVHYKAGDVLFQQGEFGDSLYIIARGKVKVYLEVGEEIKELAILGERECVGEMSLLTGEPRSAGIQAVSDLVVLRLSKDNFDELLRNQNSLAVQFAGILARRLADKNKEQTAKSEQNSGQGQLNCQPVDVILTPETSPVEKLGVPPVDKSKRRKITGFALAVVGSLILNGLLVSVGFSSPHRVLLTILFGGSMLWAFRVFSFHLISCALPLLAILFHGSGPEVVLAGFTSPTLFMVLGLFAVSAAVAKTGLLYRLVLTVIRQFPAGYKGQTLGWLLAGLLITPFLSFTSERISMASRMLRSYLDTLRLANGNAGSLGFAMSALLGFGQMSFMVLNGAVACLFVYQLLPEQLRSKVTYALWLQAAFPVGLVFLILTYLSLILFFRHKETFQADLTVIEDQLIILGPLTKQEKITILVLLFTFLGLLTASWHGINGAAICLASFLLLYSSSVLDDQVIRTEIDWNVFISYGALVGFGYALFDSGLPEVLAKKLTTSVDFWLSSPLWFFVAVVIWMRLLRLMLPALPALLVSVILFFPLSEGVGVNPFLTGLILLLASHTWFLSPEYNRFFLALFKETGDHLLSHQQTFKLAFISSLICVLAVSFAIPLWRQGDLIVPVQAAVVKASEEKPILIGLAGNFNHPDGQQFKNAVQMAVEEINASDVLKKQKIKVAIRDDQGDLTKGLAIAQALADNKELVAVIGHQSSYISTQAADVYDRAGRVMISPFGNSLEIDKKGFSRVFSTLPGIDEFAQVAAGTMSDQGYKRTVICYAGDDYARSLANAFENQAQARGIAVVDRLMLAGETNSWEDMLQKWQILGCDSFFLIGDSVSGAKLLQQARRAGLSVPVFATAEFDSPELLKISDSAGDLTIFSVFDATAESPKVQGFVKGYLKKFGDMPGLAAAQGYDAVFMLAEALGGTPSAKPAELTAGLRKLHYPGVTGNHRFMENGRVTGKTILVKEMREGKFVTP